MMTSDTSGSMISNGRITSNEDAQFDPEKAILDFCKCKGSIYKKGSKKNVLGLQQIIGSLLRKESRDVISKIGNRGTQLKKR